MTILKIENKMSKTSSQTLYKMFGTLLSRLDFVNYCQTNNLDSPAHLMLEDYYAILDPSKKVHSKNIDRI